MLTARLARSITTTSQELPLDADQHDIELKIPTNSVPRSQFDRHEERIAQPPSDEITLHSLMLSQGIRLNIQQLGTDIFLSLRRVGRGAELLRVHMNGDGYQTSSQRLPATFRVKKTIIEATGNPECVTLCAKRDSIINSLLRLILGGDGESSAVTVHIPLGRRRLANPEMPIHVILEKQETIIRPR